MIKVCTKCGEHKEATPEFFHRHAHCKDGLAARCKLCKSAADKKARADGKIKYIDKNDDDIVERSFKCRQPGCSKPTRKIYVARKDVDKMQNKFYCADHNALLSGDEDEDMYSHTYGLAEETKPSELPYLDSLGSNLKFGGEHEG